MARASPHRFDLTNSAFMRRRRSSALLRVMKTLFLCFPLKYTHNKSKESIYRCKENTVYHAARTVNVTRLAADELSIKITFARTDKRKHFYTVRIGEMWKRLPKDIRAAKSVAHFKFNYRNYMKSNRRGPGET
jgi:hypothetical protein